MDKERYKLINELKFQYLSDMKDNNRKCLSYVFRAAVSLLDALTRLSAIQDEFDKANRKGILPCTFCEFSPPSSGDVKPCCVCSACNYCIQYSYSKDCKFCPNCCSKMDLWDEEKENDS